MATDNRAVRPAGEAQGFAPVSPAGPARMRTDGAAAGRTLHDLDFYSWTQQQAELLRTGRFGEVDIQNVVEEIETLRRSERSALRSAYRPIVLHLLKLQYQPEKKSRSWSVTIVRERENVQHILHDNPGLKPQRNELFESAYASARKEAAVETGLDSSTFPTTPPFSVDDAESEHFLGV